MSAEVFEWIENGLVHEAPSYVGTASGVRASLEPTVAGGHVVHVYIIEDASSSWMEIGGGIATAQECAEVLLAALRDARERFPL